MRYYLSVLANAVFVIALLFASAAEAQSSQTALARKYAQQLIEAKLVLACRSRETLLELLDLTEARKVEVARKRFLEENENDQCLVVNIGRVLKIEVVKRYHGIEYSYKQKLDAVVLKATYHNKKVLYLTLDRVRDSATGI
jgi:hypothetical protein